MPFSFKAGLFFRIALVALVLGASAASARADVTFVLCGTNEVDGTAAQGATCSTQVTSANVTAGGNSLQATATQNVNFGNNSFLFDARAVSDYSVSISGPLGGFRLVPIDITAAGSTSASSARDAGAGSSVAVNGNPLAFACAGADVTRVCHSGSFGGVFVYDAGVNRGVGSFTIDLTTDAFADSLGGTASASLDPFIQIDPAFLAANPGFSLAFPPGIENTPPGTGTPGAVPEPASLALFGAGFLVFGTLRRRRTACITH